MRNRPIAKLIKWFVNREKGKVVDARSEIQRRFAYLDWNDQKKILLAFLSSGKADRKWAYNELRLFGDDCFLAKATDDLETYHEPDMVRTVIECFPKSYLLEHSSELCNDDYYYSFCRRLVDDPQFEIDRSRLSAKELLVCRLCISAKCRMKREVVHQMSSDILGYMSHHRSRYS